MSDSLRLHGLYIAHQAPLSMEFSKQEYWSGLPFPPPGDLLDPVIKAASPESPALASRFFTTVSSIYLVNSLGKYVVVVQSHSCVQLFATHGLQHARLPCPSLYPGVAQTHVCWIDDAIQPTRPLSPPSPSALSRSQHQVLSMNWLFASGGQSIRASVSASILPMSIQGWFPLGLTGLISM